MDLDVGIAFVILQAHIVKGAVLLDQVHFKDQGFQLRANHDPFDVPDAGNHPAGFVSVIA